MKKLFCGLSYRMSEDALPKKLILYPPFPHSAETSYDSMINVF